MDTEEKYMTSYELNGRNQQESQTILSGHNKNVTVLERGERAACKFRPNGGGEVWKGRHTFL